MRAFVCVCVGHNFIDWLCGRFKGPKNCGWSNKQIVWFIFSFLFFYLSTNRDDCEIVRCRRWGSRWPWRWLRHIYNTNKKFGEKRRVDKTKQTDDKIGDRRCRHRERELRNIYTHTHSHTHWECQEAATRLGQRYVSCVFIFSNNFSFFVSLIIFCFCYFFRTLIAATRAPASSFIILDKLELDVVRFALRFRLRLDRAVCVRLHVLERNDLLFLWQHVFKHWEQPQRQQQQHVVEAAREPYRTGKSMCLYKHMATL